MQVPMKRISLLAVARDEKAILDHLQALGVVELEYADEQAPGAEAKDYLLEITAALKYYQGYDKRSTRPFTNLPSVTPLELLASHTKAREMVGTADESNRRLLAISNEQLQMNTLEQQLLPWASLPDSLEDIQDTEHVRFILGVIPKASLSSLAASELLLAFSDYGESKGQHSLMVAMHRSQLEQSLAALHALGFAEVSLPRLTGTIAGHLARLAVEKDTLAKEQQKMQEEATAMAAEAVDHLTVYYDFLLTEAELMQNQGKLGHTERTFYLQGWVTAPQEELVRQGILQLSPSAWVEIRVPEDEEEPPILLQNHPLIEPFEGVISLFSLPKYREADPNLVMGISYWILFGMMLADAGYGLVLGVLTFGLLRIYSPPEGRKSLIWMLALCSISTTIWGVLFGGYFGEALFPPLMFSPMDNPINALILCYGLGFMHILTALTMKIMGMVKQGQALDAFFDVGMWIFVLVGAVLFAVPGLAFLAPVVFGFGIAGIILTHGRSNNGIIGKLMGGLGSLYGITGYLADILSYSRLFALGLTGGVIAMVFNIIGGLILEIPAVGIPVGVILLVTLHAVNLVLSTLSSYVHTGRLQFIEFFGKFYEGGGRAFKPFAYKLKYGRLSLK